MKGEIIIAPGQFGIHAHHYDVSSKDKDLTLVTTQSQPLIEAPKKVETGEIAV
jgi:hypothetical protein